MRTLRSFYSPKPRREAGFPASLRSASDLLHRRQKAALRILLCVVRLVVGVVGRGRVVHLFLKRRAELVAVRKGEVEIVRPAGVARQDGFPSLFLKSLFSHLSNGRLAASV